MGHQYEFENGLAFGRSTSFYNAIYIQIQIDGRIILRRQQTKVKYLRMEDAFCRELFFLKIL